MKRFITMVVIILATFSLMKAQNVAATGQLLGQLQSGTFGTFGNNNQWIGIGQPSFGGNLLSTYGFRTQWQDNAGIFALTGTGTNKNLEINYGGPGKINHFQINKLTSFTNPAGKVNYFTIRDDGNTGIGYTNPAYKLQVNGDSYINGWLRTVGKKGIYFQSYGGGLYMTDNTWIRTYGNKNFYHNTGIMRTDGTFQVGSSGSRFLVNSAGHTGIGQTAPKGPLHIGQQFILSSPHTNGGWGGIAKNWYWSNGNKRVVSGQAAAMNFTPSGDIIFRTAPSGGGNNSAISNIRHIMRVHNQRGVSVNTDYLASNVQFNVNGNLTATNHWNTSDGRFKKNVKNIDNALDKINALNGKSYQFKEKVGDYDFTAVKGQDQLGFIAAELKEVLPELVMEDDKGYQSVNYTGVIPVLVEAIKEQQDVIDEQETTITKLNETTKSLEQRLERLEALLNDSDSGSMKNTPPANTPNLSGVVLKQNAPNPFKGITTIDYEIPTELGEASLIVYDFNGKTIATYNIAAKGTIRFDASNLSNGTYVYALVVNDQSIVTQKMIIQQ